MWGIFGLRRCSSNDGGVGWPQEWEGIGPAWREAFLQAWESYQAGSIAVGAVVVDESGVVVSRGRNRSGESATVPGVLAGTYLAHAELNALAALKPDDYWDYTLCTTLESCLLCMAATTHAHVGRVVYAARDPLWEGLDRLPELNAHVARRFHQRRHLDCGRLTLWAGALPLASRALHLAHLYANDMDATFAADVVLASTAQEEPAQATLARAVLDYGPRPSDGTDLEAALAQMSGALEEAAGADAGSPPGLQ
jgi:tRNA(Arg) A34 adenosine deaminase TadA